MSSPVILTVFTAALALCNVIVAGSGPIAAVCEAANGLDGGPRWDDQFLKCPAPLGCMQLSVPSTRVSV